MRQTINFHFSSFKLDHFQMQELQTLVSPSESFWNDITVVPPLFTFSETEGALENSLQLDVFSTNELSGFSTNQTETQNPGEESGNLNTISTAQNVQNSEENGYQCAPTYSNNGLMRTYSTDLSQHNNVTSIPSSLVVTQPNMVHQQTHTTPMGYHSSSPNNVDGTNSTHSSPYTPSPNAGYEYPTSPPTTKPSIPSSTDYAGEFDFHINFGEATESAPKSAQYTYSHQLNKLFVKMNVTCPVRFKCSRPPPMNSVIRAVAVFKRPEHVTDVVTRCPNHRIPDEASYIQSRHLIRAEMPNDSQVHYEVGQQDGRESVTVFYERPQVGAEYTTVLYKFMCLSSCVGGINRRPLLTVFTLELDGQVLGRRVVEVRICSCPGRDRSQEERKQRSHASASNAGGQENCPKRPFKNFQSTMEIIQNVTKKRKVSPSNGEQEEFVLKIRGREKYEIIRKVKEALDLMDHLSNEQIAAYRRKEDEDQAKQDDCHVVTTQDHTGNSAQAPQQVNTNDPAPAVSSVFTVTDPLPPVTATTIDNEPFSMTPSHSSHPLTVTPTGESPCDPSATCFSYASQQQPVFSSQSFWPQDGSTGFDVPDGQENKPQPALERQNTTDSQRFMNLLNGIPSSLVREASGLSTTSTTSSIKPGPGRHVTRVMLRQTISLNRDAEFAKLWKEENKETCSTSDQLCNFVTTNDDSSWLPGNIKTERGDECQEMVQQNNTIDTPTLEFL
uniref:Tumor protein 63 isoform b n=1 Tax=Phallusia mammillata TaxID=59560 RepID=A0A6F9DVV8_9ASCI|nr:tumor protein 63 isoform b [Phallusia mammillata]